VTMSYRGERFNDKSIKYWLMPEISGLMESGRILTQFQSRPVEIRRDRVRLLRDDGSTLDVECDFVLLLIGYRADMTLFKQVGVELRPGTEAPMFNEATMETNVQGLYVAGTAVGGTQERYVVFIENCHVHVSRILSALTGKSELTAKVEPEVFARPES
jgi:thioredoxin reductase (NADPH)